MPSTRQQAIRRSSSQVKRRKARRTAPDDKVSVGTSQVAREMLETEQNAAIDASPTKRESKAYQLKQDTKRKKDRLKYQKANEATRAAMLRSAGPTGKKYFKGK